MQSHATAKESGSHASQPFFDSQASNTSSMFAQSFFPESPFAVSSMEPQADHVQRKCDACESEKGIQPQLDIGRVDDPMETEADMMADHVVQRQAADVDLQAKFNSVQRKCAACEDEKRVQPQLEVGPVDDPLEMEADAMADHVVRRQAEVDGAGSTESTPGLESSIGNSHGSGSPLAPHTRDQMEDAFGADFSGVRVHTGAESAAMNEEIGARAFTYGTDIHFNEGEFSPGTERGTHLLAHELTHVVQQNNDVRRAPKRVQAKQFSFGPSWGYPCGTKVHNLVLPWIRPSTVNRNLWIEPDIPGANKDIIDPCRRGKPDFYRSKVPEGIGDGGRPNTKGVRIGIAQNSTGGFKGLNGSTARPNPPRSSNGTVRNLSAAPTDIELGDLKPANSPEETLGTGQINNYITGIKNTAAAVNAYQKQNGHPDRWKPEPEPKPMEVLGVPVELSASSPQGVSYEQLDIWEWGLTGATRYSKTSLTGSLIVYRSAPGIWSYEWMPANVSANLAEDQDLQNLLTRLNTQVRPILAAQPNQAPKLKDSPAVSRQRSSPRAALRRHLQRKPKKHKPFEDKKWQAVYPGWRRDADKALGDPKSKDNEAILETLQGGKKRTGFDPGIPAQVNERAKAFETVRHWIKYGGFFGWFRKTFDRVYLKLAGFASSVMAKVKNLFKSSSGGFGDWVTAAALALFKVAKKLGKWALSIILDKVLNSLQDGVIDAITKLIEAGTPEAMQKKIEEIEALKAKIDQLLKDTQDDLEKALFGDSFDMFTKLDEFLSIAKTIGKIVSIVKWGIRIIACASPPLLGCLWNLAMAALEWAFSKVMETCWFHSKVMGWIRSSSITQILNFPTRMAAAIAKWGNDVLRLPEGIGPLFKDITVNSSDFKTGKCEPGGEEDGDGEGSGPEPTEEQKALMAVAEELAKETDGEKKFEAFMEMSAKRAETHGVAMDAERIAKLLPLIRSLTIEQMKAIAQKQVPADGIPVPVEEFLKSIATMNEKETKRYADRKIDYEKAKYSNPIFQKDEIGWKPELFVNKDVAPDSRDFADAIYDIQKLLGLKPDGMAGPKTTKLFYERNKQPKDEAYGNAAALVKLEESRAAEKQRNAEQEKQYQELLKDPKFRAALDTPFPSDDQLKKDLDPKNDGFSGMGRSEKKYSKLQGIGILRITTIDSQKMGAYFSYMEHEFRGVKKPMIVKTSRLYVLDEIPYSAVYWIHTNPEGKDEYNSWILTAERDTFTEFPESVTGTHVTFE